MCVDRKNFSELYKVQLALRPLTAEEQERAGHGAINHVALYRRDTLEIVATVDREDFFDADGNRFYLDC